MTAVCRTARGILRETAEITAAEKRAFLANCASAAEQVLMSCMFSQFDMGVCASGQRGSFRLHGSYPSWSGLFIVFVEPHRILRIGDRSFRAAPYLFLSRLRHQGTTFPEMGRVIVSIGDRATGGAELAAHGYGLLEFSRADAIADPWACIEAIDDELNEQAETIFDGFRETDRLDELITGWPA